MDYTGTFDSLAVDFATNKQKASLTLNEDARQAFENLRGKQITITIKAYKKKRSLDANSYFHVLVGKIADATGNSKVYIKNKLIAEYGQYDTDEMSKLIDGTVYEAKELGIETMTPNQIQEMKERWGMKIGEKT